MIGTGVLECFFSDGNDLDLAGQHGDDLAIWTDRLRDGITKPAFLPRLHDRVTSWYGFARDDREWRELVELLTAMIGPTYSDIVQRHGSLDADDPFDRRVEAASGGRVLRFDVLPIGVPQSTEAKTQARQVLSRLCRLLDERPPSQLDIQRPVGRVLADLDHSIAAGDHALAAALLDELTRFHALDETNLLFLHLRVLAAFGEHSQLLEHESLGRVLEMCRPGGVTQVILDSVYQVHLRDWFTAGDLDATQRVFAELRHYEQAWHGASDPMTVGSAVVLVLAALATRPPQLERVNRVLAWADQRFPEAAPRLHELALTLGWSEEPSEPRVTLDVAHGLLLAGDPVGALALADQLEPTTTAAWLCLTAAEQVGTYNAAHRACQYIDKLPRQLREAVLHTAYYAAAYNRLRAVTGGEESVAPPADWLEWVERIRLDPSWNHGANVARVGVEEWDPAPTADLVEVVTSLPDECAPAIRIAAGAILRAHPPRALDPGSVSLASHLLLLLAVADRLSEAERISLAALVETVMESAPSEDLYSETLEALTSATAHNASPHAADWLVELLQILLDFPCPENLVGQRQELLYLVTEKLRPVSNSLDAVQRAALAEVATGLEIELDRAFQDQDAASDDGRARFEWLAGKRVGIYSLMPGAARRASAVLKRLVPSVTLELNNDHVATQQLASLAANADVMVVVTTSAKHAATDAVKDARPRHLPTIECNQRGTSGILRALGRG